MFIMTDNDRFIDIVAYNHIVNFIFNTVETKNNQFSILSYARALNRYDYQVYTSQVR